jgi:hypothetical protein
MLVAVVWQGRRLTFDHQVSRSCSAAGFAQREQLIGILAAMGFTLELCCLRAHAGSFSLPAHVHHLGMWPSVFACRHRVVRYCMS